jgi:hypothetical protein
MSKTVFVYFLDYDDHGFITRFLKEARGQKLTIRTVRDCQVQYPEFTEQWDNAAVRRQLIEYVKESICFVWIFSPGFLQDQEIKKNKTQSILNFVYDHFVVTGDTTYSSSRMFTICHHTTVEQLRTVDCVMASYVPLDSSCGPVLAAQLLEIKVKGLADMEKSARLPDNKGPAIKASGEHRVEKDKLRKKRRLHIEHV